ncbi:polyprenol phosphomannose-dependent alpha 1,6 mannosyltransferase MptB [Actinoplanes sp. LDG1-06]|uniref:Polyprenol phosphomannose-dependent alpha 1,6 mannosyltransferase MptB n=1 Tax=Paractinoplanes ovalisporus TaxID=2810368 RepID=A0ABS2AU62_9ACTN|nr:polyprenol phosphomannose-dependent alpha 1,6 mannosyltransferase MptB [Actinoplanes ovalisporus]MBM2623268.1 polyprenol phosphomannose-dependent alpha 1,6 mannosyltransferase MptB [Actinoplanes ovalisporus]
MHSSRCRAHTRTDPTGTHGSVLAMPRPALVRYGGLAGSASLAVAAWLGGATDPWQPTVTPSTIFAGDDGILLPVAWLAGTGLLIAAWVAGVRLEKTARWACVTAALWMLPLVAFLPLGSYDAYSYACQGWQQSAGLDPYAGGVDVLGCPWADAVAPTWRDAPAPYGPLFLVLAGIAAKATGSLAGTLVGLRVIALLGVGLIAVALPVLARRGNVPLGRAVWLALACPLVPIHLISGAHNDALMVGLLVAGLAVAVVRKGWAAGLAVGVLLGLAVAVKATAVVVAPFALLLLLDRRIRSGENGITGGDRPVANPAVLSEGRRNVGPLPGRAGEVVANATALVGGLLLALAAVSAVSGRGFGWVTALSGSGVSVQWTSLPTALGMTIDLIGPDAVPVTRVLGIVALAGVLISLWWTARNKNPLLYAGYALAATVLLAPVFHPWYALWPLPILAATLHDRLRWLVVPCAVAAALCLPDGYNLALAVKAQGAVAMTAFILYLAWKSVDEAKNRTAERRRADHDPDRLSRRDA